MTNLLITVCSVVSNVIIGTTQMQLVPVYQTVKTYDDPECFPCHHPYLLIVADCSCKYGEVLSHYVIVPKKEEKSK